MQIQIEMKKINKNAKSFIIIYYLLENLIKIQIILF